VYLIFLICKPFGLISVSIRLSDFFGALILTIVATFSWLYVVLLVLLLVGIEFRRGLGLRQTWCDWTCGCALFCLKYVVIVIGIRVTAIAVAPHVGRVRFSCGILEGLKE